MIVIMTKQKRVKRQKKKKRSTKTSIRTNKKANTNQVARMKKKTRKKIQRERQASIENVNLRIIKIVQESVESTNQKFAKILFMIVMTVTVMMVFNKAKIVQIDKEMILLIQMIAM